MSHGPTKPNVIIVDQTGSQIPASTVSGLMVYFGGGTSLLVGQSGNLSVAVSGGSIPVTQGGPFVVSHSGLAHISGAVNQGGPWAVSISGGQISTTPPTSITAVSGLVAQSGNWLVGQSGAFSVEISGGTLSVTQSGPFAVSHSGLAHISGAVNQNGVWAVAISGGSIATTPPTEITQVSGLVAQSGNWLIGQSGAFAVSISGGAIPVTQSGPYVVSHSGLAHVSGSVSQTGPWAVSISGGQISTTPPTEITAISGLVAQSGNWSVAVSGGNIASSQSGPYVVSHSGLAHISGAVSQFGLWAVQISGGSVSTSPPTTITAVSGLVAQSGEWLVGQSGAFAVSVSGGTLPVSQSGPWVTSLSGITTTAIPISGQVAQSGAWAVSVSGGDLPVTQSGPFVVSHSGLAHVSGAVNQNGVWAVSISGGSVSTTPPTSITAVSGLVAQSGNWLVGQSGTFSVSVSGGTVASTQSGPYVVSHSGLAHVSGTVNQGGVWAVSISGGNLGTEYTEDAASASDPIGRASILVRSDTLSSVTDTNGDNVAQRGTNYGAAFVQIVSSSGTFIDGGAQYTEGQTSASIKGTAMLMEGAGNTLLVVPGTTADGITVNLGSNNDVIQGGNWAVGGSGNFTVVGNAAHDDVDLGNPIKIGAKAADALPSVVANNDRTNLISDLFGRLLVAETPFEMDKHAYANYNSIQTGTNYATPTAGKRMAVTSVTIGTSGVTAGDVIMWFGTPSETTFSNQQVLGRWGFVPHVSGRPGLVYCPSKPITCSGVGFPLKVTTNAGISVNITTEYYEW